jgi:type IV secretion system protein VirB6
LQSGIGERAAEHQRGWQVMGNTIVFASLAAQWDQLISSGLTQTVSNAVTANATLLASMLTLYVTIAGLLTCFGRMSMVEWTFGATRAAIISLLLTAAAFNQYIATPLQTDIPNWIAASTADGVTGDTEAQQFDALRNAVIARKARILQQVSGFTYVGERLECGFITICILIELAVAFFIYEFARGLIGFCVAVAPFLLGFYLFRATRHIPLNLAGTVVSLLILMMMLGVMVQMSMKADNAFLTTMQTGGAVDVQLDALANTFIFFLFGLGITIMAPSIAMRIGGGFVPSLRDMAGPAAMTLRLIGTVIRPVLQRR